MAGDLARLRAAFDPALDRDDRNSGGGTAKGGKGPAGSRIALRPALCVSGVRFAASALAIAALAVLCAAHAAAQTAASPYKPEYRLSVGAGPTYAWGRGAEAWARRVRERTSGRINIKVYPGYSALSGQGEREALALADGLIDLAVGSALVWSISVKPLGLFALPLFFPDARALDAVISGASGAQLLEQVSTTGVVALAFGDNAFHEISSADRPLRRPDDFAGLALRTSGHPAIDDALRTLGAQPTTMSWNDAQHSLQSGALQGQETTLPAFVATKSATLGQRHVTHMGLAADPLVFAVSRAAWDAWSEEDRAIVRQAAIDAAADEIVAARAAVAAAEKWILGLRGAGVVLERPTAAERDALLARLAPVTERQGKVVGDEVVQRARRAMVAAAGR